MRIEFDRFYREKGMRTYAMLNTTRVWPIRDLPLNSVVHFLSEDENLFPDISSIYLKTTSKRVLLKNVLELLPENHSQSKIMFQPMNKVLEFIKANPNFINFLKPLSEAKEPTQLVFMNYNLVKPRYRYNESHRLTPYFKWLDKQKLMWSEINNCCGVSDRNHFIDFKVPKELPSKARLNMFSAAVTSEINKYFPTAQALFILDLWKWLDPATRENSALGSVDVRHLPKCNVLFHIEDGRAAVLNLGYLNNWVAGQPNTTDRRNLKGMAPEQLKLFFLKFLMNLQSYSDTPEEDADQEDDRLNGEIDNEDSGRNIAGRQTEEDLPLDDEEGDEEGTDGEDSFTSGVKGKSKKLAGSKKLSDVQGKDSGFKEGVEDASEDPTTLLKKIEEETKALELLEERRLALKGEKKDGEIETDYDPDIQLTTEEIAQSLYKPRDPKERLLERLDDAVSKGGISAADYRKILKSLEVQDTKPDPFGSNKTLKEMATLTNEDIQISEKDAALVGDDRVLDKSMLRSVVESLDRDYVRNTMKKDVIASIMAVQSAGVLVTDVQSETQHSKLGSFVSFTITLKPIDGKSSTLRLKYPLVNEDGTFEANGVRYHMRKQRTDLPIRKIDAERVALSSYYGKLFVFRSPKKADSALSYICKHLTAASIGQIENITSVRPANVYDNNFKAPYIYNALAANYKGFTVNHEVFGELVFDFQNQTRLETLLPGWKGTLKEYESDGSVLVGRNKKGRPIIVDKHGHFKAILEHGDQPLGDIFDILSLNRLKAPVDPAMVKVMGRTLPVGVVMARAMGLKKLLKFTDARYRLVKGRQQKNLQPHEYVISFADYSLVLDRRDVRSSMIFGGFDVVHGAIKNFPIETFERKDVYDEVLDSIGAGVVVARELNLLETSYVDEITRNILIEMKEPQTFLGLLDRSCEMLLDYNTPDAQDFEHQQVRGYERFAGAIYRELMKSVRAFRNKNISGRSKVEMSPFAVWQGLMEDRSVKTCEDINPIQNLKMHESVTFAGEGGRDKDAFLKDARAMSLNDAGTFSEASVDSGDVGYNIFMSCNPHLKNLRGMRNEGDTPNEAGHYFSSSILNAVGAAHDD